jgi:signal transduction histidine kinase
MRARRCGCVALSVGWDMYPRLASPLGGAVAESRRLEGEVVAILCKESRRRSSSVWLHRRRRRGYLDVIGRTDGAGDMDLEQQLRQERDKVHSIQEIARAMGSTLDLDELLHLICARMTSLMGAERTTLYMLDRERAELWTRVLQADELKEIRLRVGEGIAGWVSQTGETVNIEDAYADERFSPTTDQRSGYRTRSILCMPLRNLRGDTTGVAQVLNKRGGVFTAEDEQLLAALVSQAAIALENSKLYQSVVRNNEELSTAKRALERRMRELDLLLEVQEQVNKATFADELLEPLLQTVAERMGAEAASILLRDRDTDRLFFRGALGTHQQALKELSVALGEGIAGWVTEHDEPAIVNDPAHDRRHCHTLAERIGFGPRNLLCVPLRGGTHVLGAIELLNRIGRDGFDDDDQRLLTLIAGRVAQAIELARYKEQRIQEGRLAAIGRLISGVLHDLRTPMTIISGCAQLMADSDDFDERHGYVEQILRQFDVMSAMTKEVLAFAKGDSHLLIRKVYMQRFAKEMEDYLRHEFVGKGIELEVDARYTGLGYFDESKLRRVFQNIGRNAAQAMPDGGQFRIVIDSAADDLVISFSDTGGGVPAELKGRLFDAFATAGKKDGTGLGLAIVKKVVEDHGGTVRYESEAGRGATFVLSLPLRRDTKSTGQATAAVSHA